MDAPAAPRWRQPAFVDAVRRSVSAAQFARFEKVAYEPFFMLASAAGADALRFEVSGSTRARYLLTVARATGEVRCTCKDALINCRRLGCVCKHACFVAYRVMKLEGLGLLRDLRLAPAEVEAVAAEVARGAAQREQRRQLADAEALAERLGGVTISARAPSAPRPQQQRGVPPAAPAAPACDFRAVARPPEPGDECPVCYDALVAGAPDLRGCPDCGKALHRACAAKWAAMAPGGAATCVYCRSRAWAGYRGA